MIYANPFSIQHSFFKNFFNLRFTKEISVCYVWKTSLYATPFTERDKLEFQENLTTFAF